MLRTSSLVVAFALAVGPLAAAPLAAPDYTGTYQAPNRTGGTITLSLTQKSDQVAGTLSGNGSSFQVQAQIAGDGTFSGFARNPHGGLFLAGKLERGRLTLMLGELGPGNQPNYASAQVLQMERVSGPSTGAPPGGQAGQTGLPGRGQGPTADARDPFSGTFSSSELTITLQGNGEVYQGHATSEGQTYPVQARVTGNRMSGVYLSRGQRLPFEAMVQGDRMQLATGGQTYVLWRGRAAGDQMGGPGQTGGTGDGGATSPLDQQIVRLLLSGAWCSFRYSQASGTSSTERVQFFPDGTVRQGSDTETYSSGQHGTVAGQHRGSQRARWRVQNGMLALSEDGVNWAVQPLQITQNSSGYPIIKSGGKEYSQCN